jgi:hypothetical protein
MGPLRSSKKRPQANSAHGRVKEICCLENVRRSSCRVRYLQRISLGRPNPLRVIANDSGRYSIIE